MERPRVSFADDSLRRAGADGAASSAQNPVQPALAAHQILREVDNSHTKDQAAGMADGDTSSTLRAASEDLSAVEAQDEGVLHTHAMAQFCPHSSGGDSVTLPSSKASCMLVVYPSDLVQIAQSLWE